MLASIVHRLACYRASERACYRASVYRLACVVFFVFVLVASTSYAEMGKARFKVNRDYGGIYAVAVPQEFSLSVPQTVSITYPSKLTSKNVYARFDFLNKQQKVKENLFLTYLKVPLGSSEKRLLLTKEILTEKLYVLANVAPQIMLKDVLGDVPIVIAMSQYQDYYVAVIGLINPKSHHSIMAVINLNPSLIGITSLKEFLTRSEAFETLTSFKYGRELM
ncbi:MAG: hypothetical protein ABII18_14015 [bacterium]|nr:hypothetical protein [bacterium]MBU1918321.1 hypothetical protein [bacterium]